MPEAGYSSTRPNRGAADAKLCPTSPCGRWRAATPPRARSETSSRCAGPEMWPYTQLARTSATQSPMVNSALEKRTAMSISSHRLEAPVPRKKWPPPHVPLIMLKPVLYSLRTGHGRVMGKWAPGSDPLASHLNSLAQKEARQSLFFRPPTRATKCTCAGKRRKDRSH